MPFDSHAPVVYQLGMKLLHETLRALPVSVSRVFVEGLELGVPSGWVRRTSVVRLVGPAGVEGHGEDVTYAGPDHDDLQAGRVDLDFLVGTFTLGELCGVIASRDLFCEPPAEEKARRYRQWALESAALDLALRQAGTTLGEVAGRVPEPVRFAVSLSLDGIDFERIEQLLQRDSRLCLKLDWSTGWDAATLDKLQALGGSRLVQVVDFKGHYHGDFQGSPPDAGAYRAVADALPETWLEDPWLGQVQADGKSWDGATWQMLRGSAERITWDAPFGGAAFLESLPQLPRAVNIKPSRFGSIAELFAVLDLCTQRDIQMYAGGQFELGPGRRAIQALASLFYPSAANDCAPAAFNAAELAAKLPSSPLPVGSFRGPGSFGS